MAVCKCYVFLVVLSIVTWIASLIVGGIFMSDGYEDLDRDIVNSTEDWDDETDINPASWAFSIWFVIYVWQAVFFVYCVLSFFPRFNLFKVPVAVFPFYIINNLCGVAWTIVAERDMYWAGVGTIAGLPITLYICLIISMWKLNGRSCRYFLYTYAVHNAWAIYAGWTTVATLLYIGITMIHGSSAVGHQLSGTIMLGVLMVELAIFCPLELTVLDKYMRHVWGHYIGLIVAIVGSMVENWDPHNRNSIMSAAIAGFVACAFAVKLARMVRCTRPDAVKVCPDAEKPGDAVDESEKKYAHDEMSDVAVAPEPEKKSLED